MPYFTPTDIPAFGRARSDTLDANFTAVQTGFNMLPTETQLKTGTANYIGTDTGIANAYVVALPYAPAAYADGLEVEFKAANTNTGASTINVNSLGVKSIGRNDGTPLVAGDILTGKFTTIRYNSTSGQFEIKSTLAGINASTRFPNVAGVVTADQNELNKLDGATATTAEINYLSGVTSAIQAQLNAKIDDSVFPNVNANVSSTDEEINYLTGATIVGWNVNNGTYSGKSVSILAQEANAAGLFFSSDGTKMYIVGTINDTIYQYALSTAWDVSTASYASKSVSVAAQETAPTGLSFKSDGTAMYIVGATNDTVYQYTLGTAWDVSTASYASKSLSVAAQDTSPNDLSFSSDGATMYMVGQTNLTIYQYTLSTPWDISTGAYASKSKLVSSQTIYPVGMHISSDGYYVYVLGLQFVYQYAVPTGDISLSEFTYRSLHFGDQDIIGSAVFIKPDGRSLYILGTANDKVYQYKMGALIV